MKKIFVLLCMVSFVTSAYCMEKPPKQQKPIIVTCYNHLFFKKNKKLLEEHLKQFAKKDIAAIDLTNTNVNDNQLAYICNNFKRIPKLILTGCIKLTEKGFEHIAKIAKTKGITSLNLSEIPLISNVIIMMMAEWLGKLYEQETITEFILSNPNTNQLMAIHEHATSLDLGACKPHVIKAVNFFPHLQKLTCKTFYDSEKTILEYVKNPKILTHINLSKCKDKPDLTKIRNVSMLKQFTNLKSLNLENTSFDDKSAEHIAKLPNLKSLNLYNTNVSVEAFEKLINQYHIIKHLHELAYSPKTVTRNQVYNIFKMFEIAENVKKIKLPGLYYGKENFKYLQNLPLEEAFFGKVDIGSTGYHWDSLEMLPVGIHTLTFEADTSEKAFGSRLKSMARSFFGYKSEPDRKDNLKNLRTLTVKDMKSFNNDPINRLLDPVTKLHIENCGPIRFSKVKHLQQIQYGNYEVAFKDFSKDEQSIDGTIFIEHIKTKELAHLQVTCKKEAALKTIEAWDNVKKLISKAVYRWTKPSELIPPFKERCSTLAAIMGKYAENTDTGVKWYKLGYYEK